MTKCMKKRFLRHALTRVPGRAVEGVLENGM